MEIRLKDKMRITFMVTSLYRGGAEAQLERMAIGLAERGWPVTIITLLSINDFADELAERGICVQTLDLSRGALEPRALPRALRMLRATEPDIVCAFMTHAVLLARLLGRLAGAKRVISSLRSPVLGSKGATLAVRATDKFSVATVMNSLHATESLVAQGVVSRKRARFIPNLLEPTHPRGGEEQRAQLARSLRPDPETFVWLCVARLDYVKAHDVLLKAASKIVATGAKVRLLLAGEGDLHDELTSEAARLGIAENVQFLGQREDVPELMEVADGLVLASRWEGMPNVVMEAMLAKLPVVATRTGGTPELVEEGVTGFLADPGDAEDLGLSMRSLMNLDSDARDRMVNAAWELVMDRCSPAKVLDAWEKLFTVTLGVDADREGSHGRI